MHVIPEHPELTILIVHVLCYWLMAFAYLVGLPCVKWIVITAYLILGMLSILEHRRSTGRKKRKE